MNKLKASELMHGINPRIVRLIAHDEVQNPQFLIKAPAFMLVG
ncbi:MULTISPECIES: hypothetical protein [unclassified Calothrix]|nr:hypothetical protein [Calothrix sp. FACHB-1219]